eukprot:CAMPEP_0118643428 /NCGR_PEP_ID=MMETSP0785-20121206/6386_1 /TAXON_ID=91992 /ORGANISM="Bolidomonas pacifica, Strain CCMP 1866" /LENGTH=1303 /DNA_ID=CAMNT_0006535091 /DNA_START=55 /DNA_END=3963 /DNA_ORIENTATION=-
MDVPYLDPAVAVAMSPESVNLSPSTLTNIRSKSRGGSARIRVRIGSVGAGNGSVSSSLSRPSSSNNSHVELLRKKIAGHNEYFVNNFLGGVGGGSRPMTAPAVEGAHSGGSIGSLESFDLISLSEKARMGDVGGAGAGGGMKRVRSANPRSPSPTRLNPPVGLQNLSRPNSIISNSGRNKMKMMAATTASSHNFTVPLEGGVSLEGAGSRHRFSGKRKELFDTSNPRYDSFVDKAQKVWKDAVASAAYATGNNPSVDDWAPNKLRTAAACEVLLNVTEVLGRFGGFMDPVTKEVIRSIYSDHAGILENPRMTRMSLQGGTLNADLVRTLSDQNRDLRDEMNMHSSGVQFSEMLKKRNAGIFKVFHRSKLVIRDIIFNAWAKYIKERRQQLKNFRTRKLAKIFNHWAYNAKYLKLVSDDPAREFKRKWQEVESENHWLVEERDRLMEELELVLMQKGETSHEVAALYHILEERNSANPAHFHNPAKVNHSPANKTAGGHGRRATLQLKSSPQIEERRLSKVPAHLDIAHADHKDEIEKHVQEKIRHMKETGLLHDMEEQIQIERDMVRKKVQRSRVDSAEKPMAARIIEKDERIQQLEAQYHKASELLQKSENEIIRLTKENEEKTDEIKELEDELCILVPARRELRNTTTRAAVNRALADSWYDKACQTPDVWEWDHKMSSAERREQEAKDQEEQRVALANDLLSKNKSAAKQSTVEGADAERRRRSTIRREARLSLLTKQALDSEPGHRRASGRKRVVSEDDIAKVANKLSEVVFAHPLKNLQSFKRSLGCDMLLSLAGVPNVTTPAMSMSTAEDICLQSWREKLEADQQVAMNNALSKEQKGRTQISKLPPLPEVVLEYLVKEYQYRSIAMKMFRSFLWACSEYRKKSVKLKLMWTLLNLDQGKNGGRGVATTMSPNSASRSLTKMADVSGQRKGARYSKLLKGKLLVGETGQEQIQEDITVYDAAKVQFFCNFLNHFFLEPVDMYDCLTMNDDTGHVLVKKSCEQALEEAFTFLRERRRDKYNKLVSDLADLPSFPMKVHNGRGVKFDDVITLFMGAFPMEREASGSSAKEIRAYKSRMRIKTLFKEAKCGITAFKLKQITLLMAAFGRYDKMKNRKDTRGLYTFKDFKDLLKLGVGVDLNVWGIDDMGERKALALFNAWHDKMETEVGWEEYLEEHGMLDSYGEDMASFRAMQKDVKEHKWKNDFRSEADKRKSVVVHHESIQDLEHKKQSWHKHHKLASDVKNTFFKLSHGNNQEKAFAEKLEVSRGAWAAKVSFAKTLYSHDIYVSNDSVFVDTEKE